MPHQHD